MSRRPARTRRAVFLIIHPWEFASVVSIRMRLAIMLRLWVLDPAPVLKSIPDRTNFPSPTDLATKTALSTCLERDQSGGPSKKPSGAAEGIPLPSFLLVSDSTSIWNFLRASKVSELKLPALSYRRLLPLARHPLSPCAGKCEAAAPSWLGCSWLHMNMADDR